MIIIRRLLYASILLAVCADAAELPVWREIGNKAPTPGEHPRILFTKNDIPIIRERAKTELGRKLYETLKWQVDHPGINLIKKYRKLKKDRKHVPALMFDAAANCAHYSALLFTINREEKYLKRGIEFSAICLDLLGPSPETPTLERGRGADDLVLAYDMLYDDLPVNLREELKRHFLSWLDPEYNMEQYLSRGAYLGPVKCGRPCDWGAICGGCGVITYYAFEGEAPLVNKKALDAPLKLMRHIADFAIYPEGQMLSGNGYINGDFGEFFNAAMALKKRGINLFSHPNIKKIPTWLAYETVPGLYCYDNRNQSSGILSLSPTLSALAANYHGPADWLQLQALGPEKHLVISPSGAAAALEYGDLSSPDAPPPKLPLTYFSSSMGTVFSRSGWGPRDSCFTITMEPPGGGHTHADKGSFTFYSNGLAMAADSGVMKFAAKYHNTILVDGKGQFGGQGRTDAIVRTQLASGLADVTHMDLKPAYEKVVEHTNKYKGKINWNSLRYDKGLPLYWRKKRTFRYVERYAIYIRAKTGAYAVIIDDIQKDDKPHTYAWFLHSVLPGKIEKPGEAIFKSRFGGKYVEAESGKKWVVYKGEIPKNGNYRIWALAQAREDLRQSHWYVSYMIGRLGSHRTYLGHHSIGWHWLLLKKSDVEKSWNLTKGKLSVRLRVKRGGRFAQVVATRNLNLKPEFALKESTKDTTLFALQPQVQKGWRLSPRPSPAPRMEVCFLRPAANDLLLKCIPSKQISLNRLIAFQQHQVAAKYAVVLLPSDNDGRERPSFTFNKDAPGQGMVKRGDTVDYLATGNTTEIKKLPAPIITDGKFAMVRERNDKVVGYLLVDGAKLKFKGKTMVDSEGSKKTIINDNLRCVISAEPGAKLEFDRLDAEDVVCNRKTVVPSFRWWWKTLDLIEVPRLLQQWVVQHSGDGRTVTITGDGPKPLKVHAPQAIKCMVNGVSVFFSRDAEGYVHPKLELSVLTHGNEPYEDE